MGCRHRSGLGMCASVHVRRTCTRTRTQLPRAATWPVPRGWQDGASRRNKGGMGEKRRDDAEASVAGRAGAKQRGRGWFGLLRTYPKSKKHRTHPGRKWEVG